MFFLSNFFFFLWLCWVFVSVRGLSLVVASRGHSSSRCMGLSLLRPLLLQSTGSRRAGSVVVAHGPSCSTACGIFPDRARTRVPCISRQILNHCTTREAHKILLLTVDTMLYIRSSELILLTENLYPSTYIIPFPCPPAHSTLFLYEIDFF